MDVPVHLSDLPVIHPELLWDTIITATVAVLEVTCNRPPFRVPLLIEDVPGFGSEEIRLLIEAEGISSPEVARLRRTYEPSRQVELAAIAITGLALHSAGGHEIVDLAVRGSGADYLVDAARHCLEIAGRSRRVDLEAAWQRRWERLAEESNRGCYVCVVEFETPKGRLAFAGSV